MLVAQMQLHQYHIIIEYLGSEWTLKIIQLQPHIQLHPFARYQNCVGLGIQICLEFVAVLAFCKFLNKTVYLLNYLYSCMYSSVITSQLRVVNKSTNHFCPELSRLFSDILTSSYILTTKCDHYSQQLGTLVHILTGKATPIS